MVKAFSGAPPGASASAGVCVMDEPQDLPQATPDGRAERERRERALDQALDQSFPASDTPAMLRPHRKAGVDDALPR